MAYPVTLRSMQTIFPSDSEGTKWQKLGANIKEAVMAAAIAVPADLTPINSSDSEGTKWYKLGRWLALIAGGGTPVPLTGVGYYTPLELLASRNIVNSDAGKWLFNTGGAKTLTLTSPGPMLVGQSLQGFQAGASAITIDAGGNTLVAPGLVTQGPGSWFEIKKIGDNLYHAHGDLA